MRLWKSAAALAVVATACASAPPTPLSPFAGYHRFFLTMPSHYAGFGMTPAMDARVGQEAGTARSTRGVVDRAFVALRGELIDAGFEVVARDADAEAVLEITMAGVRPDGEADRAFIAFRDAESGRLLATFYAAARFAPVAVEVLMEHIAESIEETVEPSSSASP